MHENGRRLQTRQYRNDSSGNEVLIHSADVEYYSFDQAAGHTVYVDASATIQVGEKSKLPSQSIAVSHSRTPPVIPGTSLN